MKILLQLLLSVLLFFCSCNNRDTHKFSPREIKELEKLRNDSISVVVDSLYKINIYVPPLYDMQLFDSATTIQFFELANATRGELKLLVNSKLITHEIIDIIQSHAENDADILFLIDNTGSMGDDIDNVQAGLNQIIGKISEFKNIRLGIALYGDKNADSTTWFSFKNFETDYSGAKKFINNIVITSGGDYPESVYDGFFKTCAQDFWRSTHKRMLILIGDAPPLEKPLSDYTIGDVIKKSAETKVNMNFYPIVVTPANELADPTTIKTYEKKKIITVLFPNPSPGMINVLFEKDDSYSIQIFNAAGVMVATDNITGHKFNKDISAFTNGAYVLRAIGEEKNYETIRFIVAK